jgi:Oligosaccharide biosynthesis protein Alg14 like
MTPTTTPDTTQRPPSPIVCFGGEDWWYHPHGHMDIQLMKRFSAGRPVLYINSIGVHMPSVKQGSDFIKKLRNKLKSLRRGIVKVEENLWVYTPPAFPMYDKKWGRLLHYSLICRGLSKQLRQLGWRQPIYWITTPTAEPVLGKMPRPLRPSRLVYQRSDVFAEFDFSTMPREFVQGCEDRLRQNADLVIYPSGDLCREEMGGDPRAMHVPHGIDEAWLEAPLTRPKNERPVIGYAGGITTYKIDLDLTRALAEALPEAEVRLIGRAELDAKSQLEEVKNITWVPLMPYEDLPGEIVKFDVAINPAPVNKWTRGANPLKFKEYLALGRTAVTTDLPAAHHCPGLDIAADQEAFIHLVRQRLGEPRNPEGQRRLVAEESWGEKAQRIEERLQAFAGGSTGSGGAGKRLKVCLASSAGGHLAELQVLKRAWEGHDAFYLLMRGPTAEGLRSDGERVFEVDNARRSAPWTVFRTLWQTLPVIRRERPDVIITTGAGVVVPACLLTKLGGGKIVYVETIAEVNKPTITGRLLHPFADLFIVQWPQLKRFFRNAVEGEPVL